MTPAPYSYFLLPLCHTQLLWMMYIVPQRRCFTMQHSRQLSRSCHSTVRTRTLHLELHQRCLPRSDSTRPGHIVFLRCSHLKHILLIDQRLCCLAVYCQCTQTSLPWVYLFRFLVLADTSLPSALSLLLPVFMT